MGMGCAEIAAFDDEASADDAAAAGSLGAGSGTAICGIDDEASDGTEEVGLPRSAAGASDGSASGAIKEGGDNKSSSSSSMPSAVVIAVIDAVHEIQYGKEPQPKTNNNYNIIKKTVTCSRRK